MPFALIPEEASSVYDFARKCSDLVYSKRPNTAESFIYGTELVTMRIVIENLRGLRFKLRKLGMDV